MLCAICLAWPNRTIGQVFEVTGGSSSLLNAEGGSLTVHAEDYTARVDLGYFGKPSLGFYFSHPFQAGVLGAGDQQIPFVLPTDLFDQSFYFMARGMSFSKVVPDGHLFAFAGATSDGFFAPFLNIARTDTPSGAIFYEKQLSPKLRLFSRNIFSSHETSIQALEWAARKDIKMALSAGLGNNQPYGATSLSIVKLWMVLDASYAAEGDNFRRVLVATPQLSENDRENIRFEYHPVTNFRVVVSRNNYLADIQPTGIERAMVQGIGAGGSVAGFQLNGAWFDSSTSVGNSKALSLGVRRTITPHFEAGMDYLRSEFSKDTSAHSLVGTLREMLNSRFSLNQVISRNAGQTTVDFGGTFLSNFLSVSVDYQTVFLPFVQSPNGQFKQVMVLGLHFQLPRGMQFNLDSNVTPLGQVRYTAYGTTYAYHGMGRDSSGTSFTGKFFQNVVKGQVLDPNGEPVAGAALQIGPELAVTDSEGNFMVRLKKSGELSLKIAFDEFTTPGKYVIVEAPQTVKAAHEDSAKEYSIVLRRIPNAVSTADPSHEPDSLDPPHGTD
jgi:hypothetical protein